MKLPQQRILLLMVRLHAPVETSPEMRTNAIIYGPFVEHAALRAITHRRIRDFRARWNAVFRKRFEGLRRPDNRHMRCLATPEDLFLHFGQPAPHLSQGKYNSTIS